jgi:Spy/CpxP family protein refolding chaperone
MRKHLLTSGGVALAAAIVSIVLIRALSPNPPPTEEMEDQRPRANLPLPPPDPLAEHLFPPELIMQFQSEIELTDPQREFIMAQIQEAQPEFEELQQRVQQEAAALAPLLATQQTELDPTLAQAEKVHDLERTLRRAQLTLLIKLKNNLTPEQRARLQEIKQQRGPGGPPPAIRDKMQRLQAGIRQSQENGVDPSPIGQVMQEFEPLIRAGQFQEAEAVLDDALRLLEEQRPR